MITEDMHILTFCTAGVNILALAIFAAITEKILNSSLADKIVKLTEELKRPLKMTRNYIKSNCAKNKTNEVDLVA